MASYVPPVNDLCRCALCGGVVGVFDTRPHKNGSISRRRRCLDCKNTVRTFEIVDTDYYQVFPKPEPMPRVEPKKKKYVPKPREKPKPKPEPDKAILPPNFKLNDAAIALLEKIEKRYDNLPV